MKKTAVIGASPNPERYSFKAIQSLVQHGHETIALGLREGSVAGTNIRRNLETTSQVDTVTLYVGAAHQSEWQETILALTPKRVVFNPGTENPEFEDLLRSKGILIEHACTLVLLASNQY